MIPRFLQWLLRFFTGGPDTQVRRADTIPAPRNGAVTKKLLPAKTIALKPEEEEEPRRRENSTRRDAAPEAQPYEIRWHGRTDVGSLRSRNEDAFFCAGVEDTGLFIVADGMGGHDAGDVASSLAVKTVCREVRAAAERQPDPEALLLRSLREANKAVCREAGKAGSNMGTTLGVALIAGGAAFIANVGDSRAYWINDAGISQITEDHSLVAKLVAAGKLTKEAARGHPKSNLLYRTIGSDENVAVDTFRWPLVRGGALLLCTDGLWGEVPDEEIHGICRREPDPRAACDRLIEQANRHGGKDNITAVLVRII